MEPSGRDNLDRWLDQALQQYGQAHSVPGLEGRILERLRERRTVLWPKPWLVFAAMGAVAGVLAVLWVARASHPRSQSRPTVAVRSHSEQLGGARKDQPVIQRSQALATKQPAARQRRIRLVDVQQTLTPKLDQFPSRRPLSPEEQMLKRYVQAFPEDAASVAREQAQLETELEKWFAETTRDNRSQQER